MPIPNQPQIAIDRRSRSLSGAAAEYIRELITSGTLDPDEPLSIDELAEHLAMSTTPVREALQTLKVEGFVDSVRGKGFAVHALTPEDIRDVFVIYSSASGELAARAARAGDPALLRELEALHFDMQAAAKREDPTLVEALNFEFHSRINRAVDAPKLKWVVGLMAKYAPRQYYPSIEGWPRASVEDHGAIIDAFAAEDGEAARRAMSAHLAHAGELLARHFGELHSRRADGSGQGS